MSATWRDGELSGTPSLLDAARRAVGRGEQVMWSRKYPAGLADLRDPTMFAVTVAWLLDAGTAAVESDEPLRSRQFKPGVKS